MALIACGINYKTASVDLREQVYIDSQKSSLLLQDLISSGAANEAVILSTCNRTEFYLATQDLIAAQNWLRAQPHISIPQTETCWYFHYDEEAVRHIMRVACGLDSMVLGEPQILGQMKQAYFAAQNLGVVGNQLQRLLSSVFTITKQIRTHTKVGMSPISMAYAVVQLAKQIFAKLENCEILLVGAGPMIELAATYLAKHNVKRLIFANRSLDKAQILAEKYYGHAIALSDIPVYLPQADITVTATGSPLPLVGKGAVERALKLRKRRPMFMVDLAVPRDIEAEIANLDDVYLYNVDDLKTTLSENLLTRQQAAQQAEEMIAIEAKHFMREIQSLDAASTICAFRNKLTSLSEEDLIGGIKALERGEVPAQVLNETVRNVLNKIMHTPSVKLKQAAFDGQAELLIIARRLFDLP